MSTISFNKYARFKYTISGEMEAGLVLTGPQVKAIRAKTFNIRDSIVRLKKGEFWLMNLNFTDPEIPKDMKLLLNQKEINKINQQLTDKKIYVIPMDLHFKGHIIKLQIGLGKHKNQYDKRDAIRKADDLREIQKEMKSQRY